MSQQLRLPIGNTTRAGSRWRKQVQDWLADHGIASTFRPWLEAGDDIQVDDPPLSIETKAVRRVDIGAFVDQAETQRREPGSIPLVIIKRRGRPVGDAYVITRLHHLPRLLGR